MFSRISFGLVAAVCSMAVMVQSPSSAKAAPVAYAFVSTAGPSQCTQTTCGPTGPFNVYSVSVSSSGSLTQAGVTTSPMPIYHLSVTKSFLFGIDSASNIYSYSISSTGALKLVATTHTGKYVSSFYPAHSSTLLQVDETGRTLYSLIPTSQNDRVLASFKIESNGELQFLGTSQADPNAFSQIRFVENNQFALMDGCYNTAPGASFTTDSNDINDIVTYKRESNGFLTYVGTSHDTPAAKSPYEYCAGPNATDPTDHMAILFSIFNPPGDDIEPGFPLGTYTVNSNGEPSTSSSDENMPVANFGNLNQITIDPTGKLLAIGGGTATQFFHFNGAGPITKYSGGINLGDTPLEALAWDTSSHFFALSQDAIRIFDVTPKSYTKLKSWDIPDGSKNFGYSMIVLSK